MRRLRNRGRSSAAASGLTCVLIGVIPNGESVADPAAPCLRGILRKEVCVSLSDSKRAHMNALSTENGVIAAAAMDQRGSLQKPLAKAKGVDRSEVTPEMMAEFKSAVTRVLTPYASAILLDPEYGLEASRLRNEKTGLLLAYEKSGYDNTRPGRLPDLLDNVSVYRIVEWGADAVKILMHYAPNERGEINDVKKAFIERIGAECFANGIPFFLELIAYDENGGDEKGFEFAKRKPEAVTASMEEFSKAQYGVDVLKVEIPVNAAFVEGSASNAGAVAYSKQEAIEHYRAAAAATRKPFIYLSAGVENRQFIESLEMANEAGVEYSGVLCGRATWKDGMPVYAKQGVKALEDWLANEGVRNITAVNNAIRSATPWFKRLQ
ncbi:MAG: tagatose 1,6-diphosphate aldolase [Bryobacteraceae bacterium]|nr:tagatose 1,6-diphosphate aldolase [Bryobacteraceae bacterium]